MRLPKISSASAVRACSSICQASRNWAGASPVSCQVRTRLTQGSLTIWSDPGGDLAGRAAGAAAGQGVGQHAEAGLGFGQGLGEAAGLGGMQVG
jgi:hypothetical protein